MYQVNLYIFECSTNLLEASTPIPQGKDLINAKVFLLVGGAIHPPDKLGRLTGLGKNIDWPHLVLDVLKSNLTPNLQLCVPGLTLKPLKGESNYAITFTAKVTISSTTCTNKAFDYDAMQHSPGSVGHLTTFSHTQIIGGAKDGGKRK